MKKIPRAKEAAILEYYLTTGYSIRQTALAFDVHAATVQRVLTRNGYRCSLSLVCETCDSIFEAPPPGPGRKSAHNCPACEANWQELRVKALAKQRKLKRPKLDHYAGLLAFRHLQH
jgi:transposase-like protein